MNAALVLLMLTASFAANTVGSTDTCAPNSSNNLRTRASAVERAARVAAEDLCPDQNGEANDAAKTDLLNQIRDRILKRPNLPVINALNTSDADVLDQYDALRRSLAMRRSDVQLDGSGRLAFIPAIQTQHAPGFATLPPLTPTENQTLQSLVATALADANQKVAAADTTTRKRVITDVGGGLRSALRDAGEIGYERAVAENPLLLFVGADRNVEAARAAYQAALAKEAKALPQLATSPPEGPALGLIFYGPAVVDVLRENPILCGAFHGLKRKIKAVAARALNQSAAVGFAAVGMCLTAAVLSSGVLGPACIAASGAELAFSAYHAAEISRESQLLYGGALAGAGTSDYENKRNELTGQLVSAAASLTGLNPTLRVVGREATRLTRQVELKLLLRQRERLGTELNLANVPHAPGDFEGHPALRIDGDDASPESLTRLAGQLKTDGYALEVSPFRHPSTLAVVDHDDRVVTIYGVRKAKDLQRPSLRGVVRHERRHISESKNETVASRINLQVKKLGLTDEATLGRYGSKIPLRGDEPFAFYDGAHAESTFSKGTSHLQTRYGHRLTTRTAEILSDLPKDFSQRGLYDRQTGLVFYEFKSDVKSHLRQRQIETFRKLSPGRPDVGEYAVSVRVSPNQNVDEALAEGADMLMSYRRDINKLRDNYDGQIQMIPGPAMPNLRVRPIRTPSPPAANR